MKKLVNKLFGGKNNQQDIKNVRKGEILLANYQANMHAGTYLPMSR